MMITARKLLLYFVSLVGLGLCAATAFALIPSPTIHVWKTGPDDGEQVPSIHWRIENHSAKPIVIYASFLYGPAAGHHEASGREDIYTSLMKPLDVDVNAYPEAKFVQVAPGASLEGELKDAQIGEWSKRKLRMRLAVSWGLEEASVQKALASQTRNPSGGHPANPIVAWQRIGWSNEISLR